MRKIGVIGSRRRDSIEDYKLVAKRFFEIYRPGDWIVSGGCPEGGDRFAQKIAKEFGIPILIFYPNWPKYKRGAGFMRNTEIAKYSDVLVACVTSDRTGGTEDTIAKFLGQVGVIREAKKENLHLVEEEGA